ncbi:helix-turn-helix domain-containing protein [Actinoplanes palleronii]|uniref:HTH merR-type domain-containing protein n=1 Tax=Actinoplanes palleronii TaxID=113570 RepID=A0ABQ4BR45_9ACTN|nr:MerR family transcriptional regulator [Actinoplanes palleronii]GIE73134.1 hypothetical protein Apa02nite_092420 [Actinoplanes palleronii]
MRIAELADLTDTTVRTIRYYHQIGLLPVPACQDGFRDYDLSHLARLARIRWLARAGIALVTIGAMLDDPDPASGAIRADLRAAVDAVDEQMRRLQGQRDRLTGLIDTVDTDGRLSPMPVAMARFYDRMQAGATDPQTRRVIRRERNFLELAFYRGDMPPESVLAYEGLTEASLAESSALFDEIADRVRRGERLEQPEMDAIATAVVDRIARRLGGDMPRLVRSIDQEVAQRAVDLYVRLADPGQRQLARVIGDAVLTTIEKGHAS